MTMQKKIQKIVLVASLSSFLCSAVAPLNASALGIGFAGSALDQDISFGPRLASLDNMPSLEEMMSEAPQIAAGNRRSGGGGGGGRGARRGAAPVMMAPSSSSSQSNADKGDPLMAKARALASSGQYQDASKLLFQMSRSPKYVRESAQIKYILGLMLYEMKLYQSAAFAFYDVVRQESRNPQSKYLRQSLEKLALAADQLNSDVLLRYAIKMIKEDDFPAASREMLYYRTGEIRMQEKDFAGATREFVKIRQGSQFYTRARYKLGLALAEAGNLDKAQLAFEDLAEQTRVQGVTDPTRVGALLGRARVLYQRQQFDAAIEAYRDIPRDTEQWHEALFESSWAMLRDGRFRSALSNFHSLHSSFYDDFYQPESLFLRAIVYLYICKYDEMEKVLGLFEKIYRPVQRDVKTILETVNDPIDYYKELARIQEKFESIRAADRNSRRGLRIPFLVGRQILKEGDVRRTLSYLENLNVERVRLSGMPTSWRSSAVGQYSRQVVEKRIQATQTFAGRQVKHHLSVINDELKDLFEQSGFLKFEMLSGKKEALRKEIAGKDLEKENVDRGTSRNYYIQNGFEYWPFTGEYWLDEIGNYQYVGVKACE